MNKSITYTKNNYLISTNKKLLQLNVIHQFLSNESYWAKNIQISTVKKTIKHSFCFGLYSGKTQIGFARLITDYTTFAYMADVFILPEWRGKGLAKWLMHCINIHPKLTGLKRWLLFTRDAHNLYAQFNWEKTK